MKVKNKIFYNFVKQSYQKISEFEGKEEVYLKDLKLAVVVNDEEVGRQIYDIIKTLKERNDEIKALDFSFKINKYFVEDENTIKIFLAEIKFDQGNNWKRLVGIEKIKYMLAFIKAMEEKGYILDDSKFDDKVRNIISDFLTFFSVEENEKVKKDMLKIISVSDFEAIDNGELVTPKYDYIIVNSTDLTPKMMLTEEEKEYSVYGENIKIYHNMPEKFGDLLRDQFDQEKFINYPIYKELICREIIEALILDFDFKVIGYKFRIHELQGKQKLSEIHFENQSQIISFISNLDRFLDATFANGLYRNGDTFILEDNVVAIGKDDNFAFQFNDFKDIYDFMATDPEIVNQQMVKIFFQLLLRYCNDKYGEMNKRWQFLRINEIRYLPPRVAQEFVKYATGKKSKVDFRVTTDSFMEFMYYHKKLLSSINKIFYYDDRYIYSPEDISIIYNYELKDKYGIPFHKKLNKEKNGISIVTYSSPVSISELENTDEIKKIQKHINKAENVKVTNISKIICDTRFIDNEECFCHFGYVVELPKGRKLTDAMLLSLDSKEIYRIMASWVETFYTNCKFSIPLDTIWVNDDYTFTINIWDKNFTCTETNDSFMVNMVKYLLKIGYNPYVFEYNPYHSFSYIRSYIDETDTFCNEHKMYYKSSEGCPACKRTKFFIPQDFKFSSDKVLYEDVYAKHYYVDEPYYSNFKIYNPDSVDMLNTEKCIDDIISSSLTGQDLGIKQDAFLPIKKLIDSNNKFIGYAYDPIDFNDKLINLLDTIHLSNKARLKCLIALVTNIKEILDNNLGFTQNPFGNVYLNYNNKRVQILNIELVRKNANSANAEDTFRWTYNYVQKVISEDSYISVDLSDCKNLNSILDELQKRYKEMTSYCNIHKIYYKSSNIFCPECAKKENLSNFKITKVEKDKIMKENEKIENGGESWIYAYGKKKVAKIFKPDPDINMNKKMRVISKVLGRRKVLEEANNNKNVKFNFIIPQEILVEDKPYGYIMEKVQNARPISVLRYSDQREEIEYSMKDILEVLIIIGQGLEYLHDKANMYIGDLNGANILFDEQKNVYFLDFDGVGIDEIAPVFVTPEYIDPISNKTGKFSVKDDWYSYAVQVFCYLTFTHPFNGAYEIKKGVYMDITERMEKRISLLGDYGITPPFCTKSWDWMDQEMINKFLSIFEGDYRESIVSDLIRQYDRFFKNAENEKYTNFVLVNSKAIAKEYNPFKGEIDRVLNQYSAICHNSKKQFVAVLIEAEGKVEQYNFNISHCKNINNVLISENKEKLYMYSDTRILCVDVKTKEILYKKDKLPEENVVLDGNTLYVSKQSKNYIVEINIAPDGSIEQQKIVLDSPIQPIKKMLVKFNSKFLFVKFVKAGGGCFDEVFCNDEKLCNISICYSYNILFDSITNSWLVLNGNGDGIVITFEGKYKKFNIEEFVDDTNVEKVQFNKGRIFIPANEYLYIITVNSDQIIAKKMVCNKVMTRYSKLYDINTDGFSVITDNTFYDVRKE